MSNIQGKKDAMLCPQHDHEVRCYSEDCATNGCAEQREVKERLRLKAEAQWELIMKRVAELPDHQQTRIIECGMRLRELACFYGPYFTQALMITSAEIGAGRLIMPKTANCDDASNLMMPGGKTVDEFKDVRIIVPGAKGHS